MSLARLLTLGRSLVAGEDRTNRYRLSRQRLLPTFGAGGNPFTPHTVSDSDVAPPAPAPRPALAAKVAVPPAVAPEPGPAVAPIEPREPREVVPAPAPAPAEAPTVAALPAAPRAASSPQRSQPGWLTRLNPFAVSRSGGTPARTAAGPRPTQGELSLDQVRVVRNDLSDGDEDGVPDRAARPVRLAAQPAAAEPEVEEATVNRLNRSFKRAEQVSLL
jgi:hypothetical protein